METKDFTTAKNLVKEKMKQEGLELIGEYRPAKDANRWVFVYTASTLKTAVKKVGGFRAFALAQRIAITKVGSNIHLSATMPTYWGAAYFQEDFSQVKGLYASLDNKLKELIKVCGVKNWKGFGSAEGIELADLLEYQYMFGMPYFEDRIMLAKFKSHAAAKEALKRGLRKHSATAKLVYSVEIGEQKMALYGIGLMGPRGESHFLPIVDIGQPYHTCFLPYEILVLDNKAYMLHGRFRIALSFPDLTMGTFSKIMSTPGDIEDALDDLLD